MLLCHCFSALLYIMPLGRSEKIGEFQLSVTYQPKVCVDVNVISINMNIIQNSTVALVQLVWALI